MQPVKSLFFARCMGFALVMGLAPLSLNASEMNGYQRLEEQFKQAELPVLGDSADGWYTGRCYTRRAPETETAGALVFVPAWDTENNKHYKQIVPAVSLRSEPDYFDDFTDEEYEMYKEEIYEESNFPTTFESGSLRSDLYYGFLIGSLWTRQMGTNLIVTMTNYEESPLIESQGHFYCLITKKVRDYFPVRMK
jgi:hypothetical protein